jgi:hypothetical protein
MTQAVQPWREELARNRLRYPNERVVAFLSRLRKGRPDDDLEGLDVGFGHGRHVQAMMDVGIRASGIEIVDEAVAFARDHFAGAPLAGDWVVGDIDDGHFEPASFDVILEWGVAFLKPRDQMVRHLAAVGELLREDGRVLVNFRDVDSWLYGLGEEVGNDEFVLDERTGPYAGMHYTFLDRAGVERLIPEAGLEPLELERQDLWLDGASQRHSWWVVEASRAKR